MNNDKLNALAKLGRLADRIRKTGRLEIVDSSYESFSYREVVALHDLFEDLTGDVCHDRNCPVHFKGVQPTGEERPKVSESPNYKWLVAFTDDYEPDGETGRNLKACVEEIKSLSSKLDLAVKALSDWRNTLCTRSSPAAEQTFAVIDSHGGEVAYIDYVIEKCGGPKP